MSKNCVLIVFRRTTTVLVVSRWMAFVVVVLDNKGLCMLWDSE